MSSSPRKRRTKGGRKVRVPFRRKRSKRPRATNWTQQALQADGHELDAERSESVVAKGALSRRRTVIVGEGEEALPQDVRRGTVIAMRGLYAEVDDGECIRPCTIRRILRTRLIKERHPVTVGDRVRFRVKSTFSRRPGKHEAISEPIRQRRTAFADPRALKCSVLPQGESVSPEGVIEAVEPRRSCLQRHVGRRIHTIAANVDQAIIVSSADEPPPKPHLIDRYIVASHAGEITPVICMNKLDLDRDGSAKELLDRYAQLGYVTLYTSATADEGIDALRNILRDKASVITGQSGVGKSSLLNAVQPGLRLKLGDIVEQTSKGRHTTSTAGLIRLEIGGYVVDTPGIKSLDLSTVGRHELEAFFVEFVEHVPNCKFPDCTHTHESDCAVKRAVESGQIHPERYESYVRMFEEPTVLEWRSKNSE